MFAQPPTKQKFLLSSRSLDDGRSVVCSRVRVVVGVVVHRCRVFLCSRSNTWTSACFYLVFCLSLTITIKEETSFIYYLHLLRFLFPLFSFPHPLALIVFLATFSTPIHCDTVSDSEVSSWWWFDRPRTRRTLLITFARLKNKLICPTMASTNFPVCTRTNNFYSSDIHCAT